MVAEPPPGGSLPERDAERELALTASLLDTVLSRAPVGFALLDRDLRVIRVNEALADLDGFPLEAHLGLDMVDLWPAIARRIGPALKELPATGAPLLDFEVVTDNWQGRRIEALVSCYPVGEGVEGRIGVLVVDVTERNRLKALTEEALRVRLERQASAIEVLQRGLLPRGLPELAGVELSAAYRAAARDVRVGGDWYDVLRPLGSARIHLTVGDVAGHGLDAVETMGQLRNAGRGWFVEGRSPGQVLTHLDRLLRATLPGEVATIAVASLDPAAGELVLSLAGHLPPLHLRGDGSTALLTGPTGPPVGVAPGLRWPEARFPVAPGDTVVLYTDGLVERRDESIDAGLERLRQAAEGAAHLGPAALVDRLLAASLPADQRFDDICVLAVRVG